MSSSRRRSARVKRPPATLYRHQPHPHIPRAPRNPNERHAEERQARVAAGGINGFNERVAIKLSGWVSTMWMAYAFAMLAVITIWAVIGGFGAVSPQVAAVGEAISQTFIQLVFLPILALVSRVQSRQGEIQADEQYHTSLRNQHDIGQVARHMDAQDREALAQRALLERLAACLLPPGDSDSATPADTATAATYAARLAAVIAAAATQATPATAATGGGN